MYAIVPARSPIRSSCPTRCCAKSARDRHRDIAGVRQLNSISDMNRYHIMRNRGQHGPILHDVRRLPSAVVRLGTVLTAAAKDLTDDGGTASISRLASFRSPRDGGIRAICPTSEPTDVDESPLQNRRFVFTSVVICYPSTCSHLICACRARFWAAVGEFIPCSNTPITYLIEVGR